MRIHQPTRARKSVCAAHSAAQPHRVEPLERRQLLSAGTLDQGFGSDGIVTNSNLPPGQAMAVQSDGKIVVAGANDGEFEVSRYNYDGTIDTSFGDDGTVITDLTGVSTVSGVAIDGHGRIVVVGTNMADGAGTNGDFAVLRYTPSGSLDHKFNRDGIVLTSFGGNDTANAVTIEPGSIVVVAGTKIDTGSGQSYFAVARYTSTGQSDDSFGNDGEVLTTINADDAADAVAFQGSDIVVAGTTKVFGDSEFAVVRYTANGAPDTTFDVNGELTEAVGTSDATTSVAIQSNGGIIVGGTADDAGTIISITSAGARNTSFGDDGVGDFNDDTGNVGSDTSGINSLAIESDGKILAGGFYTTDSDTAFTLGRFDVGGFLDSNFGSMATPNGQPLVITDFGDNSGATAISLSPDGRIVAAGGSTSLDLARYLNDVGGTDSTPPTAVVTSAPKVRRKTTRPYTFTVTYTDNVAVNVGTLGNNNILVTGPDGFSELATFFSATPNTDDPSIVATYEIAAPRRGFRVKNDGPYVISLQGRQVRDTNGNAIPAGVIGTFKVKIAG